MSWFSFLQKGETLKSKHDPLVRFGRFSDSYKTPAQYKSWEDSIALFERKEYLASFESFFHYINNESNQSVKYQKNESGIDFSILQGSKIIIGKINNDKIIASSKIVKANELNIGFLRKLVEENYSLQYSRYALDNENHIVIKFDSYFVDCSPYKIYYALKELATKADKDDDLLLSDFSSLSEVENHNIQGLALEEKEVIYEFLTQNIEHIESIFDNDENPINQHPAAISTLLLSFVYRMDYLLKPEGKMMDLFEKVNARYFETNEKSIAERNIALVKDVKSLKQYSKESLFKEWYNLPLTFGLTSPISHEMIVNLINNELPNMNWYISNKMPEIALSIPNYLVGYILFNYAPPKPIKDLLHIYFQVVEADYFNKIGELHFKNADGEYRIKDLKVAFEDLVDEHKLVFTKFKLDTDLLNFSDDISFAKTFLYLIASLDVKKIEST